MTLRIGSKVRVQGSGYRVQNALEGKKRFSVPCTLYPARGFTLIEVLMAISILAIGVVGVLRAYSTSVSAIERAQYNIDAGCLLKAVMGRIEEKAITEKGTSPGESSGDLASSSGIKIDTTQSDEWQWIEEVRDSGLKAKAPAAAPESEGTAPEAEVEAEAEAGYSLNEVKLTAVNYERVPSNKVSVITYMDSNSAGG